jgi:hypothetical protein
LVIEGCHLESPFEQLTLIPAEHPIGCEHLETASSSSPWLDR